MVKFVVSPEIQRLISDYNTTRNLLETDDEHIQPDSPSIEHVQLVHISSTLQALESSSKSEYSLNSILKTTTLYFEPIEKPEPVGPRYSCVNGRIQNIKQEWKRCDAASSNKNTTP